MSSPQPSQQTEHIVVYGIPIASECGATEQVLYRRREHLGRTYRHLPRHTDQEAAVLTRRVLNISIAMALIAITSFILSIISGDFAGTWASARQALRRETLACTFLSHTFALRRLRLHHRHLHPALWILRGKEPQPQPLDLVLVLQ